MATNSGNPPQKAASSRRRQRISCSKKSEPRRVAATKFVDPASRHFALKFYHNPLKFPESASVYPTGRMTDCLRQNGLPQSIVADFSTGFGIRRERFPKWATFFTNLCISLNNPPKHDLQLYRNCHNFIIFSMLSQKPNGSSRACLTAFCTENRGWWSKEGGITITFLLIEAKMTAFSRSKEKRFQPFFFCAVIQSEWHRPAARRPGRRNYRSAQALRRGR